MSEYANGSRVIDIGGLAHPEEDYEGRCLVIFAIDPGVTSGWSALKVPVGLLSALGVTRTLARCRWRHGQILRSGWAENLGPLSIRRSDSHHASLLLSQARTIHSDWVWDGWYEVEGSVEDKAEGDYYDAENDIVWSQEREGDVFVMVSEGFGLRLMSMDPALLAPERINSILVDRLVQSESETPLFFQLPSEAMTTVTDARLLRWAMYDPGSGVHARDADRHAILFLRNFAARKEIRSLLGFGEL